MTSTSETEIIKTDSRGRMRTPARRREQLLQEFAHSGASARKFSQLAGIHYQTFVGWIKRYKPSAAPLLGTCHRAHQNQPLVGGSKPASLRSGFHSSFVVWFKRFGNRLNEPGPAASPSSRPRRSSVRWIYAPWWLPGIPAASL